MPAMTLSSVLFPEPLLPTMPKTSRFFTVSVMPLSAQNSVSRARRLRQKLETRASLIPCGRKRTIGKDSRTSCSSIAGNSSLFVDDIGEKIRSLRLILEEPLQHHVKLEQRLAEDAA